MERATGNDPASIVWKTMALPLSYARIIKLSNILRLSPLLRPADFVVNAFRRPKMVGVVRLELTYPWSQAKWDSRFPTPRNLFPWRPVSWIAWSKPRRFCQPLKQSGPPFKDGITHCLTLRIGNLCRVCHKKQKPRSSFEPGAGIL